MDDEARLRFLTARVESLTREKEEALTALEAAAGLGHFDAAYSRLENPEPILRDIAGRARDLLPFRAVALYLVDEETQDMVLSHAAGEQEGFDPEAEIDALIGDHSFSLALGQPGPSFFVARHGGGRLMLHRLATPSRVRGMFLGLFEAGGRPASDTALALVSVLLNAGAAALESYFLYRHLSAVNQGLERKVAARTAQLRRAYDELRVILDSVPAGVVVIDPEAHRVLNINAAGAAMLGLERESVIGRSCFDCFCSDRNGKCPMVEGGQRVASLERNIRDASGREIPILKHAVWASLVGRACILESFVDISEQKKLESLREDVERMTRHDLKAPLTGIIGLPDVLMGQDGLSEDQRGLLALIKESGLRMLDMINLSLDLYKMEAGTYVLDPRPVEVCRVLENVMSDLRPHARCKGVVFRCETDGGPGLRGPVVALGEELLFFSLFSNLLKNAVEASPQEGEVVVSLLGRDRVWIVLHNAGAVPRDIRNTFFDKYVTSGKSGGTGLGSYSARLIVQHLGGSISFATDEDAGTTFFLSLPRPDVS